MKKQLLIISALALILASCGISAKAQTFKPSGKTAEQLSSEEITNKAEGDFNKDGVKDLFVTNNSGSAFYFGKAGGGYNLFHDYDLSVSENAKLSVTDKGVLRIQQDTDDGSDVFLFRYQDNCMRLIGGKKDRHKTSENYDISFNYLTSKMITTTGAGSSKQSETEDMEYLPILRFGWFPLDYDMLEYLIDHPYYGDDTPTPEWKEAFGIFRLIQDKGILFGFFNDYDNSYHDLKTTNDKNYYNAEFITERPCTYNHYSSCDFIKQTNGTYLIEIKDIHQDRSYEAKIEHYFAEHEDADYDDYDEIMEQLDIEVPDEESSSEKYIFDDGKFIEQK